MDSHHNLIGRTIVLYYASSKNPFDGANSFEFWFNGAVCRIICDKPFARGDVAVIDKIDGLSRIIRVSLLSVFSGDPARLPLLLFAASRLYFDPDSRFNCFSEDENIEVIETYSAVNDDNLLLCGVFLYTPTKPAVVKVIESNPKSQPPTEFSWHISIDDGKGKRK